MVFIAEGPWFTGDEHEPWACELVCLHAHAFIQAIHVAWYEVVLHVRPPHPNHLLYFPKFVDEGWGSNVGEGKGSEDGLRLSSIHPNAQTKRGPMKCVNWAGCPELSPLGTDDSPH